MKNKNSQSKLIYTHLLRGKNITPIEALNRFGCFRLAARIHDIRKMGARITQKTIHRKGKSYASYSLAK